MKGCLVNLLIGFGLLVAAFVSCAYLAVAHTAMPVQLTASMIERVGTNQNLQVNRIAGSISSGVRIRSVSWIGGELVGVLVRSTGFRALLVRDEIILHDVNIAKARLDVTNWNTGPASMPWPVRRFQIDRLTCRELVLTNRVTGFSARLPGLEWTGFAVAQNKVELGRMKGERFAAPLAMPEALAKVFYDRAYAELAPEEKEDVDGKLRYLSRGLLK